MSGSNGKFNSLDLLFEAAATGNWRYVYNFVRDPRLFITSSTICAVDSKGRNILHIALISKQHNFIKSLFNEKNDSR